MMENRFIQTPSGRFHAVVGGEGERLFLVHGYGEVNTWRTWERNVDALAKNFQVYALELLGYGESDGPRLDAEGQANALVQLLDADKISGASFMGLSWGGEIVQHLALDMPERVNKVVLVDSVFDSSKAGLVRLGKIVKATLIVWDEDDAIIPVRLAPLLAKAIPNSRLAVLTKAQRDSDADPQNRHWTQMTHSFLFNQLATEFLLEKSGDEE
jgi:pimeloyl-ACP methyl ester carboxylesterase